MCRPGRSPLAEFLIFVLQLIELVINAALREQLLMSAHFAHLAFVHDNNLVGLLHGERRWAMMMEVRPSTMRARASRTRNSVSVSTLEVASSRTRILGSCARARAKEINCFCPVDRVEPRSRTSSWKPPAERG